MKRPSTSATIWMASPAAASGPSKAKATTVNDEVLRHIEWVFGGLCVGLLLLAGFQAWQKHVSLGSLVVIAVFSLVNLAIDHWIRRRPGSELPLYFHTALGMLICPAAYLLVDGALQPWWPAYAIMATSGAVVWTFQGSAKWGRAVLLLYMVNMLLTAWLGLTDPPWLILLVQTGVLGAIGVLLVELTDILSQSLTKIYERSLFHRKGKEEFQELARLKTDFFANVSHEFRTPITLTLGPLEAILRGRHGELSPELRHQLEVAVRNQQRLLGLINQILDSAKVEANAVELKAARQPDFHRLIAEAVEPFHELGETRGVEVRTSFDPLAEGIELYFDREKIEKILLNLLSNSMKFTKKGHIELSTEVRSDRFLIRVSDTGMGIKPEELPHVFERYRQAKGSSQSEFAGTGLGLNLVREFARLHGGEVTAESVYGQGTSFEFWIPLGRAHLKPEQIVEAGDADSPRAAALPHGEKEEPGVSCAELNAEVEMNRDSELPTVVCAEDNPELRYFLRDLLRDGHNVFVGANGEEGLALAEKWRPDLILSDVAMPKVDGMEFCRRIRENSELKSTPFVLLTARTMTESRLEGLGHGADDYLTKPFSEIELIARVRNLISLRRQQVRLQRELTAARAIQAALLPAMPQGFAGLGFDLLYHPSEQLSGDFCDVLRREDWAYFYVADVTSHGTASAQVTYLLKEIVSELVERAGAAPGLPELLCELQARYASRQLDYDVAIQLGRCHLPSRKIEAVRGGAPSPVFVNREPSPKSVVIRPSHSLSRKSERVEPSSVAVAEIALAPGEAIYFFTDGCYEFPAGSRDYGAKNLQQALARAHAAKDWKRSLLDSLAAAHGNRLFPDDLTCLRIMPEEAPPE